MPSIFSEFLPGLSSATYYCIYICIYIIVMTLCIYIYIYICLPAYMSSYVDVFESASERRGADGIDARA
jgi:hypothetical protein